MMQYNYDAIKDWAKPPYLQIVSMCILAIALVIIGLINIRLSSDIGIKIISLFFSIGLGMFLFYFYAIRKGRPFVKTGIYTITIENGHLKWNMKLHSESKIFKLSEIKEINQSNNKFEFTLNDGSIQLLRINQIRNRSKREEFINIIRSLKTESSQ